MNNEVKFEFFANLAPQKYYDNKDQTPSAIQKREEIMANKGDAYVASVKSDGEWCMLIKAEGKVLARSRSISKVTGVYGDYTAKIPHIIEEFNYRFPDGTVLLGELCFDDFTKTSKDVGSILRCLPPKAIERQKDNPLYFIMFDRLAYGNISFLDKTYRDRFIEYGLEELEYAYYNDEAFTEGYIRNAYFTLADFDALLAKVFGSGGEGIVIQRLDAKYVPGGRPSWQSLKVKRAIDEIEVKVIGLSPANIEYNGKSDLDVWQYWSHGMPDADLSKPNIPVTKFHYYGWPGAIIVNYKGKEVSVSSGLTDDDRDYLSHAGVEIAAGGIYATIGAMEETEDGSLRHPVVIRLREDLDSVEARFAE